MGLAGREGLRSQQRTGRRLRDAATEAERHRVAVVTLHLGRLAQVIERVIQQRPVRGCVLGRLHARLGSYQAVAPVEVVVCDAVGRRAAGVLDGLRQVTVADAGGLRHRALGAVVDIGGNLGHVRW